MPLCSYPVFREQAGGLTACGQCLQCRIKKRREKTARVVLEGLTQEHTLYVTLTYMERFLPREIFDFQTGELLYEHPQGCLDQRAIQLFMKRLRKCFPPKTVRVFYCGEYGDENWRPHYHLLLFGVPWDKRRYIYDSWCDPFTGLLMCDPDRLDVQVPRSDWDVGQYVSGYVMKKLTNPKDERLEGRSPEFFNSSKGIGLGFVEQYASAMSGVSGQAYIEFYKDIPRTITINGKKLPLDRYMRGKILDALQITEIAKETGFARYQEEMQALQDRASQNPQVPQAWLLDVKRLGWALEKQYGVENAAATATAERRHEFFASKRRSL